MTDREEIINCPSCHNKYIVNLGKCKRIYFLGDDSHIAVCPKCGREVLVFRIYDEATDDEEVKITQQAMDVADEQEKTLSKYGVLDENLEKLHDTIYSIPIYEEGSKKGIKRYICWTKEPEEEDENC